MNFFFTWILPPLIGAIIGLATNWLAIKMLFRPLHEIRIAGIRLPFTPGLLPKERRRISRNIGDTVAGELLTVDVVRKRLSDPDIRESLERAVAGRLEETFAAEAASLIASARGAATGPLSELATGAWKTLVSSEAFSEAVGDAVRSALRQAENLPLSRILPPSGAREVAGLLLSPENAERAKEKLAAAIEKAYAEPAGEGPAEPRGGTAAEEGAAGKAVLVAGLVPADALEPIIEVVVESLYRAAVPAVESFLRSPGMRKGLERHALGIVRQAVSRLNLFQRLIVGAAQYEKTIADTMPETVEELLDAASDILRGKDMPAEAAHAAVKAFRSAAAEPVSALARRLVVREAALRASAAAMDALGRHGPDVAERAAGMIAARPELTLGELLSGLGLPADELAARAARIAGGLLLGEGAGSRFLSEALESFVGSLRAALVGKRLGEVLGADAALRARLASWLAERALALVSAEAEKIIEGLDVARIVVEKLDELDMIEAERIILSVVNKELAWITLLGGVLGGLIGIIQSLLNVLSRN
ncbi:MAG: DUF445 family protein [Spirochaetaceae bacterium]|nr:DUF445 family protein [Spirochaetaceae bacterium]